MSKKRQSPSIVAAKHFPRDFFYGGLNLTSDVTNSGSLNPNPMTSNMFVANKAQTNLNPPQTFRARDNLIDKMRGKKVSLCENLHPTLIKSDDCKNANDQGPTRLNLSRTRHQKNISEICKKGMQLESVR